MSKPSLENINKLKEERYVIVKYADNNYWKYHFPKDPKVTGVLSDFSCSSSYVGKQLGIKEVYTDLEEAERDLKALQLENPSGGYAICPVTD